MVFRQSQGRGVVGMPCVGVVSGGGLMVVALIVDGCNMVILAVVSVVTD